MSSIILLKDRHTDATRQLILATALELLEKGGVADVTVRAVAKAAGMSERTVFRYFATRDDFLDAVAAEAVTRMESPPPPGSIDDLRVFPRALYKSFEDKADLISAILHTEIFKRVRAGAAGVRWKAVENLVSEAGAHRTKAECRVAATNINYYLSATTWHYYRFNFELSPAESISCATTAVELHLNSLLSRR